MLTRPYDDYSYASRRLLLLSEYAASRPMFEDLWNGFMEAFDAYDIKRENIDADFEARPLTSELRASRAFQRAKENAFKACDEAMADLIRSVLP